MKNNGLPPPHQEACHFYKGTDRSIVSIEDTMSEVKQIPLGLILAYVLRLICIIGLLIFSVSLEYVIFLAVEMTVLTSITLVLPRSWRLCLFPLILLHVFQCVNVILTGNFLLQDILQGFMVGQGSFDQLFWTLTSAAEGFLLWIPSFWSQSYVRIGKPLTVVLALMLIATLSLNLPIHRFVVQEYYAIKNILTDDGSHRNKIPVYRESLELL